MTVGARVIVGSPTEFGPTGPPHITVMALPANQGTHMDLSALSDLGGAVSMGVPLMMSAEGSNVYYSFASAPTGGTVDAGANIIGPTAINQCGVLFVNTRTVVPEVAPQSAKGLKWGAGTGATATFRIWRAE